MKSQSLASLSTLLTLSALATAATINLPRNASAAIMQLNCTIGMPAMMCNSLWGTFCSSNGEIIQPAPSDIEDKGDCSSAHCSCALAAPVPCATGKGGNVSVCGFGIGPNPTYGVQTAPHQALSTLNNTFPPSMTIAATSYSISSAMPSANPSGASSNETMQLICTTGMPGVMCIGLGTQCSSDGKITQQYPSLVPGNGDCTSAHCTCKMAPPIPCVTQTGAIVCGFTNGPNSSVPTSYSGMQTAGQAISLTGNPSLSMATRSYGNSSAMPSGPYCTTVTVTVTHFRDNMTHTDCPHSLHHNSTFTGGGQYNGTGHHHHHHHHNSAFMTETRRHSGTTLIYPDGATTSATSMTTKY